MDIKRAKQEIEHTIQAYLSKDEYGEYQIPAIRQRPVLLMGPPGIGKTQIMEQIAKDLRIGLVAYTITHHTRQSAVGLPFIKEKTYGGKTYSVTEYTMSEIIASVYEKMEQTGCREGILFIDEINCVSETLAPTMLQFLQGKTFGNQKVPEGWVIVAAGNLGPDPESITIPGNCRKVITVGAFDHYSGCGPTSECICKPELVAPGTRIISCYSGFRRGVYYTRKSGTSMAAPAVAGAVALLLEQEPELTNVEVKMRLKEAAVDTGMPKNCQGWGMPDLRRLLLWHADGKRYI